MTTEQNNKLSVEQAALKEKYKSASNDVCTIVSCNLRYLNICLNFTCLSNQRFYQNSSFLEYPTSFRFLHIFLVHSFHISVYGKHICSTFVFKVSRLEGCIREMELNVATIKQQQSVALVQYQEGLNLKEQDVDHLKDEIKTLEAELSKQNKIYEENSCEMQTLRMQYTEKLHQV